MYFFRLQLFACELVFVINNETVLWDFVLAEVVVGGTPQEAAAW